VTVEEAVADAETPQEETSAEDLHRERLSKLT